MSEMIKRVASAIYAVEGNRTKEPGKEWRPSRVEEEDDQELYLDYARAAIKEVRELTDEMLNAAYDAEPTGAAFTPSWEAAIDAALSETDT